MNPPLVKRYWIPLAAVLLLILLAGGYLVYVNWIQPPVQEPAPAPTQPLAIPPTSTPALLSSPDPATADQAAPPESSQDPESPRAPVQPVTGRRLVYNGEVLPESQVPIIAQVGGQVVTLRVEAGDSVQIGDTLLQVESLALEAQRAQALASLVIAQAQLALLAQAPEPADLEAAQAAVNAAQAAYQRALDGPTEEDLRLALAQLRQAEAMVKVAQAQYDRIAGSPFAAMMPESLQLEQATLQLEAARAQYDKVEKGATADVISGAYAQLAQARAQMQRLKEGAKPAQIEAADAQVRQAEAALYLAQLQLDKTTVHAPIDGVVAQVNTAVGATIGPTTPALILLSHAVKVLIAVEESRLPDLAIGQPALIQVDAYSDRIFDGQVAIIAPALDPATRTVAVTIRPIGDAALLAPGMSATVELR